MVGVQRLVVAVIRLTRKNALLEILVVDGQKHDNGKEGHDAKYSNGHFEKGEKDKGVEAGRGENLLLCDAIQLRNPAEEGLRKGREIHVGMEAPLARRVKGWPSWAEKLFSD